VARDGDGLARALRAAGIESAVADHVMRLRDRVRAARYGPLGVGDAAELAAELEQVLRVLGAEPGTARRRRAVAVVGVLICAALLAPPAGSAQAPTAEALYEAGALRAAADSFAGRAAAYPHVAAHWYNLGATLYRAGADGKAVAAWTRAARLAPRDRVIERAREFLLAPDAASDPLLAVGPATPGELALAAALGWAGLWAAVIARRRRGVLLTLAGLTAGAAAWGAVEASRRTRPVAVVVGSGTAVRVAPYGTASANATVDAGAALLVVGRYGRWLEVRRRDDVHGWVLGSEVVPL
jgi:tetratricopeptide (TPR) repeat protein